MATSIIKMNIMVPTEKKADKEYVLLNYSVFPTNDAMHLYYHVPNKCFTSDSKFKKYFYSPGGK